MSSRFSCLCEGFRVAEREIGKFGAMRILFCIFLLGAGFLSFSQNTIYDIDFYFSHSRRIPNANVEIKIERRGNEVKLSVKSTPAQDDAKWAKFKVDTSFAISMDKFNSLINSVKSISCENIVKEVGSSGLDGTTCEIKFGDYGSSISYEIWSPDYDTKKRNLTDFLNACTLIVETAGLNPKEIF